MSEKVIDARDELIDQIRRLTPGSTELLNQVQAIKILSGIDIEDRKLEFEMDKEETRKLERANDLTYSEIDRKLHWIETGIKLLDVIINPATVLTRTAMNNKVKIKRDVMGYTYEETGVIGSHTFNNALKDKYD